VPTVDDERLLTLLRDPNVESQEIAALTGVAREEAGRASRLLHGLARARPEDVLTLPAPLAAAIARAAADAGRTDLLAALASHASKEVGKAAKRGLHLLRIRGVAVPEPPRPGPPQAAPAPADPPLSAYASTVDGQGDRAVWLPRAVPGKGIEVGQAVVSDVRGLVELQVALLGRKEWRSFSRGILERGATMGVAEIDREAAKALVAEARARNDRSGQRPPDGADLWLQHLGPAGPVPDVAERFPPLAPDEEAAAVAASGMLHDLPLLRGWLPEEEFLRDVARRLDEIGVSPLYVDERQRLEQMARTVADASERYFDEPRRRLVAGRLLSAAEHLDRSGDAAHAPAAAAAGRALAAGTPVSAIPFARLLVEKAFPPEPSVPPAAEPAGSGLVIAPR